MRKPQDANVYKKVFQPSLLFIMSILFVLLFAEIVFRICIHLGVVIYPKLNYEKSVHRYSRNKELVYELKESFTTSNGRHKTNKYGMRDYEYSLTPSSDTTRICVLGDSVAYGLGVPMEQTFENLLEVKLNSNYIRNFEVLNFSVTGYNARQEEIILKNKVLKFKPDIVMVAFCPNDDTYTDGLGQLAREMSPYSIGSRMHSKLISYLLYRYEKKIFNKLNDIRKVENFFSQLAVLKKKEHLEVLIVILPYYFKDSDSYYDKKMHVTANNIAKRNGLKTLDFFELWKDIDWKKRKALYCDNDSVHFSILGMTEIADELFKHIN